MSKTKRVLPIWNRRVKKALIDKNLTVKELAEKVNYSTAYVTNVVNGKIVDATKVQTKINEVLGINER